MKEILEIAGNLAEAISKSERYLALRNAERAVEADPEAKDLLDTFTRKTMAIVTKEQALKPVEPAEKREVVALKEKIAGNSPLQALSKAQADYSEMMNKVNKILFEKLDVKPT